MNLEGVVTSVNYADFLAETLPINLPHFDRLMVVTTPEDLETQRVCDFWNVQIVLTDSFQARWGEFHKARGINDGLSHLKMEGWVLHLDADIALPPRTRTLLDRADLDRTVLHGADRLCVPTYEDWVAFKALPQVQHDGYHVRLGAFGVMPRFNAWHLNGYAPPGYFQLWHPSVTGVRAYPDDHSSADRTDVLFAQQWPRAKRALLPELAVYHLESEASAQGTNWGGRQTTRFGPKPADATSPSEHRRHRPHNHHHHRPDPDPYRPDDDDQGER